MRRTRWAATAMAAAVSMACGRGSSVSNRSASMPDPAGSATGAGSQGGTRCDGSVTVVIRGVDAGGLAKFDVDIASLAATVDGGAVSTGWSASGTLALGGAATPELFAMARSHAPVDVTLALGKVHVCDGQGCSDVDVCGAPITFRFDVDKAVPDGCHVFLELDLASSVQPTGAGKTFLPTFSVKYW